MRRFLALPQYIQQYLIITGNYWAFTLTDGALRMLVVLSFYAQGYSPITIASLLVFYEFFGVVTNLLGGWLAAKWGLNRTMHVGLFTQIVALSLLLVPPDVLNVFWIMLAQALSGIAKDLNKMSAKSAIKILIPASNKQRRKESHIYRWVTLLTGSKNALKGVGFFLGGLLLTWLDFRGAVLIMIITLCGVLSMSLLMLKTELGKVNYTVKCKQLFAKSPAINYLSAARFFLFGARDIWFVVAVPITLGSIFGWSHTQVGTFFAAWMILYGLVQATTPQLLRQTQRPATAKSALLWVILLTVMTSIVALITWSGTNWAWGLIIGLFFFGGFFAINSAIHSYLIISYANTDGISLDVGFYYMANAAGRLVGTLLSGLLFQTSGLLGCLVGSVVLLLLASLLTLKLTQSQSH